MYNKIKKTPTYTGLGLIIVSIILLAIFLLTDVLPGAYVSALGIIVVVWFYYFQRMKQVKSLFNNCIIF